MEKKNNLLIVGVVLAVLLPPVGLIICLIELNDIKKNDKPGKNLAVNGIMVSIIVMIVMIVASIVLVTVHNKKEADAELRRKYRKELQQVCATLKDYEEYDNYDPEHPHKKVIQCRMGDCFMYKDNKLLESIDCDTGM